MWHLSDQIDSLLTSVPEPASVMIPEELVALADNAIDQLLALAGAQLRRDLEPGRALLHRLDDPDS